MSPHNSARGPGFGVKVRLYERAGEATATLEWSLQGGSAGGREERAGCTAGADIRPADSPSLDTDPDSRPDHDRRAVGRLRRYAVENGCSRLVTLTYAEQTDDLGRVARDSARFLRRLRERHGEVAYVRVFERHESGNLHVHVAVNRWLPKPELAALWGHGFVDVRLIRGKGSRPGREAARKAARYIAKYVVKDPVRMPGGHRYEVRQGRQPGSSIVWVDATDPAIAIELVLESLGVDTAYRWSSAESPDWLGPPMTFSSW